jgi:CRISP-associated protein Cas1
MIAYLVTQGARVVRQGRHLVVIKGNAKDALLTHNLEELCVVGNIEFSQRALAHLFNKGIETTFITTGGRFVGRLELPEPKNIFLRKRQFVLTDDSDFCLKMARSFVTGKLLNQATLLMRISRTRRIDDARSRGLKIRELLARVEEVTSVDSLRGYEGKGSALYFGGFAHGLNNNFGFSKRVRRPPTDPVNSVLSLVYTFLMNRIYTAVRLAHLEPYLGYLHSLEYGRHSLVLDLMEEFRPIVADSLVLSLFNLKILQDGDFITEVPGATPEDDGAQISMPDVLTDHLGEISYSETSDLFDMPLQQVAHKEEAVSDGKYPVRLTPAAFERVIQAFERKLVTKFFHPIAGREMTYNDAFTQQARMLRQVVEGQAEFYQPLLLK